MSCYHCGGQLLSAEVDIHGLPEVTCVFCGREQVRTPPDSLPLHDAEYIEMMFDRYATRAHRKEVKEGWSS